MGSTDNLFPVGGFPMERRVRLGRSKLHWVEMVAECDAHHFVPPQLGPPAENLHAVAAQRNLEIVEGTLPGKSIGLFDLRGIITVDRAKIRATHGAGSVEGVVRSTVSHELGHAAIHRHALGQGVHNEDMEREAGAYAAAFLLPRYLLEVDATLLRLQGMRDAGRDVPEFYLWQRLQVVATRFGVTRSLVVERLVKLGFLQRRGRRVWIEGQS